MCIVNVALFLIIAFIFEFCLRLSDIDHINENIYIDGIGEYIIDRNTLNILHGDGTNIKYLGECKIKPLFKRDSCLPANHEKDRKLDDKLYCTCSSI